MTEPIDRALISCIHNNYLVWYHEASTIKVALIGEINRRRDKATLRYKLAKRFSIANITVFTKENEFAIEDGKEFDLLIGCRPCRAEELILESAAKYGKRFILLPCACNLKAKIPKYIREHPVISHIDAYSPEYDDGGHDSKAWMILFNKSN